MTKFINRKKVSDIRAFNVANIEETLKGGRRFRTTRRKLGIGRDRTQALRDENGKVTNNMNEIVRIAEKFYTQLYDSDASPEEISDSSDFINGEVLAMSKEEEEHSLKIMNRGKAAGEDGIIVDLLKDGGPILLEKLAKLYTCCLRTRNVPVVWKNVNIILILKKRDTKGLEHYRPISLLSVLYKLFT